MHKFFCSYNNLTEKYELSLNKTMFLNSKANILAENSLMGEIKDTMQRLYDNITLLKENITEEDYLTLLDESELLLSNIHYSIFSSPLELNDNPASEVKLSKLLSDCIVCCSELESKINIEKYNRPCHILKNNFQNLLNACNF